MDRPTGIATGLSRSTGMRGIPALAAMLEEAGYDSVWFAEVGGPDAITCMTTVLNTTERIKTGPSVIPIYIRSATLCAFTFASMSQLGPGRVLAGLGVSSPAVVEQWNGLELKKPLTAMREYIELMRAIWTEEKVTREGHVFRATNFRPFIRPAEGHPVPIWVGALNPPMLRLAGALADGVKLNWLPASLVPEQIRHVREGAEAAGRDPNDVTISCNIRFAVTDTVEAAHPAMQRALMGYVIVPMYRKMFTTAGYGEECTAAMAAWDSGDRKGAASRISPRMREDIIGVGTQQDCRDFIQSYIDEGVQYPVLMPMTFGTEAERVFHDTATALA